MQHNLLVCLSSSFVNLSGLPACMHSMSVQYFHINKLVTIVVFCLEFYAVSDAI